MTRKTSLVVVLLMTIAQFAWTQTTLHVPATYPTIQAGIDNAVTGDTVLVSPGTYYENLIISGKEIRLISTTGATATIVDGSQSGPVLCIKQGLGRSLLIEGFTFTNGRGADGFGFGHEGQAGGIYIQCSSPTISKCHILGNKGGDVGNRAMGGAGGIGAMGPGPDAEGIAILKSVIHGNVGGTTLMMGQLMDGQGGPGGVQLCEANMYMRATIVDDNVGGDSWRSTQSVGAGGVQIVIPRGPTKIEDSVVCYNAAGDAHDGTPQAGAGGIHGGSPEILFCVVDDNRGGHVVGLSGVDCSGAGGIYGVAPAVMNTYVRGNIAGDAGGAGLRGAGGGIHVTGPAIIGSSVITGNKGGDDTAGPGVGGAGGLHALGGNVTLTHCTMALNQGGSATNLCGCGGLHNEGGNFAVDNSILWNNLGGVGPVPSVNEAGGFGTVAVAFTDIKGGYGGVGNMNVDPCFVNETGGDFHLQAVSPCRESASLAIPTSPARDIDGEPRLIGSQVDMGADEFNRDVYPGTGEDLVLESIVNYWGDPLGSVKYVRPGDNLETRIYAPLGGFSPSSLWLLGSVFATGSPPSPVPGLPGFQLDPSGLIVLAPGPYPIYESSWPLGHRWFFQVGHGFSGWSFMMQGFALDGTAANGWFAATDGHELRF